MLLHRLCSECLGIEDRCSLCCSILLGFDAMNLVAVEAMREAVTRVCQADLHARSDFGIAVNDALYHARALPEETVRAIVASERGRNNVRQMCRVCSALAPAGPSFRLAVARALPDLVQPAASASSARRPAAAARRARADLAALAALADRWAADFAGERALRRQLESARGEHAPFDEEVARVRRRREEAEEAAVEEAARALAQRPPEAVALDGAAGEVAARAEALLGQIGTLFEVLGAGAGRRLEEEKADDAGLRDGLRDIWAELVVVENECDVLYTQACQRLRLDAALEDGGTVGRAGERGRNATAALRAMLERIGNERRYCEAMQVSVPAKRVSVASLSCVPTVDFADSSAGEEWEDPVFCKDSESEDEELGGGEDGDVVPTLPTGASSSAKATPQLTSAEMLVVMSNKTTGAAHNASALACANAGETAGSQKKRASAAGKGSRQRLKAKLGKKRKRASVQLSP